MHDTENMEYMGKYACSLAGLFQPETFESEIDFPNNPLEAMYLLNGLKKTLSKCCRVEVFGQNLQKRCNQPASRLL